jgi:hypothetical protein
MRIIGLSGRAGAGKDTVADILVRERGYTKIALADPLKRICREAFAGKMTDEHLWGPSEKRNEPIEALGGLTARKALQTLGTEWGRACYPNIWIDKCLFNIENREFTWNQKPVFVIPDVRFLNELKAIHAAGGEVWRIIRNNEEGGLQGEAAAHVSENELTDETSFVFNARVWNVSDIAQLKATVLDLELRYG